MSWFSVRIVSGIASCVCTSVTEKSSVSVPHSGSGGSAPGPGSQADSRGPDAARITLALLATFAVGSYSAPVSDTPPASRVKV